MYGYNFWKLESCAKQLPSLVIIWLWSFFDYYCFTLIVTWKDSCMISVTFTSYSNNCWSKFPTSWPGKETSLGWFKWRPDFLKSIRHFFYYLVMISKIFYDVLFLLLLVAFVITHFLYDLWGAFLHGIVLVNDNRLAVGIALPIKGVRCWD